MAKSVFYRLLGRSMDEIPYGTHDEDNSLTVTPVKYAAVVESSRNMREITGDGPKSSSSGFVQMLRNSFRRQKKLRNDYDLITENRPSPFKTPPPFLVEKRTARTPQSWESPFGLELLEECITRRKLEKPVAQSVGGRKVASVSVGASQPVTRENDGKGSPSRALFADEPPSEAMTDSDDKLIMQGCIFQNARRDAQVSSPLKSVAEFQGGYPYLT